MSQVAPAAFSLLAAGIAIAAVLLVLQALRYRSTPSRAALTSLVVLAVVLTGLGGVMGYNLYTSYMRSQTWTFSYYVDLRPNATGPDAVVLPSVGDESLLSGLSVGYGVANWSFVNTVHGRELYVAFTGNTSVSVYISRYPPPDPVPDARITTVNTSTGQPEAWVYYPGTAGVSMAFGTTSYLTSVVRLQTGWTRCPAAPPPPMPMT